VVSEKGGYDQTASIWALHSFFGGSFSLLSCSASGGAAVSVLWVPATMPRSNAPEGDGSSHFARSSIWGPLETVDPVDRVDGVDGTVIGG
jgi:hypothetical protein